MGVATLVFLCIGGFALLVLLLSLIGAGHHFHLLGHHHGVGAKVLSMPGLAGLIGGFGFGAAAATQELSSTWAAAGIGVAVGIPFSWAAGRLMSAADTMSTDATPASGDVIGATGVVISDLPAGGGLGQVRVRFAGQPMKFNARAEDALPIGARVLVVDVLTPTCVFVQPLPGYLSQKEGQ
jgi:membrane protein implicated in regulation of membrane protease activity